MALNKDAVIEKLKAAGVELTGEETLPELKALLKAIPGEEDDTVEGDAPENGHKEEEDVVVGKGKFRVTDSNGKVMPSAYKTEEEAIEAAKIYGGKVQK